MSGRERTQAKSGVRYRLVKENSVTGDRQTEAFYVPGLSCERGVHRGGRGVHQRVSCARREKDLIEMAGKIINQRRLNEDK
jgi:hypothetical protein